MLDQFLDIHFFTKVWTRILDQLRDENSGPIFLPILGPKCLTNFRTKIFRTALGPIVEPKFWTNVCAKILEQILDQFQHHNFGPNFKKMYQF